MKRVITVLALGSALLLAACGDSEDEPSAASADTPTATATATETPSDFPTEETLKDPEEAPAEEPSGGGSKSVAIQGFAFGPKTVKVKVGDTITWSNGDAAPHTATAKSGGSLDSGTIAQGASFEFTAEEAGTIEYFCEIHPSMVGTIDVS